jgi:GntR family histidine utilization transcriptional repressor
LSGPGGQGYRAVYESIHARIQAGEWPPGGLLPGEAELAAALRCSRTTVNRALQLLAEEGLVERRRRAGTRIVQTPIRRATFEIPIIRLEVEGKGAAYRHEVLESRKRAAPKALAKRLGLQDGAEVLYLATLHRAGEKPFMFEKRWINLAAAPAILDAPFDAISANEWLVRHIPMSSGDIAFSAIAAAGPVARALDIPIGAPIFLIERTTYRDGAAVTAVAMHYPSGHRLETRIGGA